MPSYRAIISGMRKLYIIAGILLTSFVLWRVFSSKAYIPEQLQIINNTNMHKEDFFLTSSVFEYDGVIPKKYTCDGENLSPPLEISGVPEGAKTLVLIMDDPDVPKNLRPDGVFDHWVVFNISSDTSVIPEGEEPQGVAGINGRGEAGYTGPCPPDREHRYFFKLYALDTELKLSEGVTKAQVEQAMNGHIVTQTELMGKYDRRR
jgi:Raf kinase inhibitor-like YbhB/YbcL family protein